jgi:hypothetical protein
MSKKHKIHAPEFKAKVSLEAIKGLKTTGTRLSSSLVRRLPENGIPDCAG